MDKRLHRRGSVVDEQLLGGIESHLIVDAISYRQRGDTLPTALFRTFHNF